MLKRVSTIIFLFIMLLPFSAHSEIREESFEVNPFAGGYFFGGGQNLNDRPVYGLRLGYNFTKNCGIEGSLEYVSSLVKDANTTSTSTSRPPFVSPDNSVKNTLYHIDAIYHFNPEEKFNPFLVAGIGGAHFNPSSTGSISKFLANFGVGAKYWLSETTALRADVRDIMTFDKAYHNAEATVGIVFAFGGRAKAASKPEPAAEVKPEITISKPEPTSEIKPEPRTELKPVAEIEKVIVLEDIHFDFDKATLTNEAKNILKKDIQILKENSGIRVRIEGHSCAHGAELYNLRLSERRVNAVKESLIKEGGITSDRLSTIAYGETKPVMPEVPTRKNKNSEEAKANRRVHFEVIVK